METKALLVDLKKLSELTSIGVPALRTWASIGKIPSYKPGRKFLFDPNEVTAAIKKMRPPSAILHL